MPRDGSGIFTLPPGNPVVSGSIIESAWANNTMADLAAQLNNVLTRDGLLNPTAPVRFPDGSAVSPAFTFVNQTNLGLYRKSSGVIGVSILGVEVGTFTAEGFVSNKAPTQPIPPLQTANFTASTNTVYRIDPQTCTSITFPTTAIQGQWIELRDPLRKWWHFNTTIASNKFNGVTQTFVCDTPGESLLFTWIDNGTGWEPRVIGGI